MATSTAAETTGAGAEGVARREAAVGVVVGVVVVVGGTPTLTPAMSMTVSGVGAGAVGVAVGEAEGRGPREGGVLEGVDMSTCPQCNTNTRRERPAEGCGQGMWSKGGVAKRWGRWCPATCHQRVATNELWQRHLTRCARVPPVGYLLQEHWVLDLEYRCLVVYAPCTCPTIFLLSQVTLAVPRVIPLATTVTLYIKKDWIAIQFYFAPAAGAIVRSCPPYPVHYQPFVSSVFLGNASTV